VDRVAGLRLIDPAREVEGVEELTGITLPQGPVSDILDVDLVEHTITGIVHAPPPKGVEVTDSGDSGKTKRSHEPAGLAMPKHRLVRLDPTHMRLPFR
jgi:hypothetical protein